MDDPLGPRRRRRHHCGRGQGGGAVSSHVAPRNAGDLQQCCPGAESGSGDGDVLGAALEEARCVDRRDRRCGVDAERRGGGTSLMVLDGDDLGAGRIVRARQADDDVEVGACGPGRQAEHPDVAGGAGDRHLGAGEVRPNDRDDHLGARGSDGSAAVDAGDGGRGAGGTSRAGMGGEERYDDEAGRSNQQCERAGSAPSQAVVNGTSHRVPSVCSPTPWEADRLFPPWYPSALVEAPAGATASPDNLVGSGTS